MCQSEATILLKALSAGNRAGANRLMELVYDHLHQVAHRYMARERKAHTLDPTALVNEAFLKLVGQDRVDWQNRSHFLAVASQAMRRILVDHARSRNREKRGGGKPSISLEDALTLTPGRSADVLALDESLEKLAKLDEIQAKIVEMRFFGGMSVDEVAEALGLSKRSVERKWTSTRAWLRRELESSSMDSERHQQVCKLFEAAVELEGNARLEYLDLVCREDPKLRDEVGSLLLHHDEQTLIPLEATPQVSVSLKPLVSGSRTPSRKGRAIRLWLSKPITSIAPRLMLVIIVILTMCLALLGEWVHQGIERSLRQNLETQLQTILKVDVAALENWIAFENARVERWAQNEDIRREIGQLVRISEQPGASRDDLLNSAVLKELIRLMEPLHSQQTNLGFTVISRAGKAIADDNLKFVGAEISPEGGPYLRRILLGETILSKPSPEGHYTVGIEPDYDNLLMFVASPVTNAEGDNIAAMVLKFPADEKFTQILSLAQLGETGETYAFDLQADALSDLRNPQAIKAAGLLFADSHPDHTSLKVQIRDPGGNLTTGYRADRPNSSWPTTKMATLATSGHDGSDMIGYRNYLGIPVLGVWRWLPEYDFGVATEMTVKEAYAPLRYVRWAFGGLLSLLGLLFGFVLVTSLSHLRLHRDLGETTQLGEYTLKELIGQGGMGKVYKAQHALLRRPTAIKLLDGIEADRETVLRFEREVQLTSELTHPNTIQIYDFGRTQEEIFYYVMEFLPGLNLGELVAVSGALPAGRVIHLLRQICGSLAEAHQRGLIHRDIKPANIMLCDRGGVYDVIKVLDFGLAKSSQSDQQLLITGPQQLGGTPRFIAPERIQDPSTLDPRSDIYSLGAVTFFLLAGRHVYTGKSTADVLYQVMNVVPERLSQISAVDVPQELDELVAACLAKTPEDRPESIDVIMKKLDQLANAHPWSQEDALRCWEMALQSGR